MKVFPKAVFYMSKETYWDIFTKSGKIEDYLNFCNDKLDFSETLMKGSGYAPEHQGIDFKGTEYR